MTATAGGTVPDADVPRLGERPLGYHLVTPPGWNRIDLDEGKRRAAVERIVAREFAGIDNLPHIRVMATDELDRTALQAAEAGAIELYVSTLEVKGVAVSSSLVVSLMVPPPGANGPSAPAELRASDLTDLARAVSQGDANTMITNCEVRPLGLVDAVRRASTVTTPGGVNEEGVALDPIRSFGVDWYVPVPHGDGALLMMSFSSPLMPLREGLEGLFDAVAATLRWS